MLEIQRVPRKVKTIPLISLIDVVFQLLIYMMLTTSFTRMESLELALPSAAKPVEVGVAATKPPEKTLHVYISDTGEVFLERASVGEKEMQDQLSGIFTADADRGVLVMSASKVSVGSLVRVLDRIYSAGGRNIAVADWMTTRAPDASVSEVPHG